MSTAPIHLASPTAVADAIAHYRARSGNGTARSFAAADLGSLLSDAVATLVRVAQAEAAATTGAARKQIVMTAIEQVLDSAIPAIDFPYVPEVVEKTVIDPAVKAFLLKLASGMVDSAVTFFNRTGWADTPTPPAVPDPAAPVVPAGLFQPY